MTPILIICLSIFSSAWAAEKSEKPKVWVKTYDSDANIAAMNSKNNPVQFVEDANDDGVAPDPAIREAAFQNSGLLDQIKGLDQLDRDFLFLRAGYFSEAELISHYPNLNPENLKKLQSMIKNKDPAKNERSPQSKK